MYVFLLLAKKRLPYFEEEGIKSSDEVWSSKAASFTFQTRLKTQTALTGSKLIDDVHWLLVLF